MTHDACVINLSIEDAGNARGSKACGFGEAIGVIGWLFALLLLIHDVLGRPAGASPPCIKVEFIFTVLWTLMMFIGFCYFCDEWRQCKQCSDAAPPKGLGSDWKKDWTSNAGALIAFSFFGTFAFAFKALQDFQRVKYGDDSEGPAGNPYTEHEDKNTAYVGDTGAGGYQGGGGSGDQVATM